MHPSWLRCSDVSRSALLGSVSMIMSHPGSVSVIMSHPMMCMGLKAYSVMEHSVDCTVLQ